MSQAKRRADRIRSSVSILQLLQDYGYHISSDWDREQQFSCDLHGDGYDKKPSARAYPDTNKWYCFSCDRLRDPIQTVREKEGTDFWTAIKLLEHKYHLPPLPWEQDQDVEDDHILRDIQESMHVHTSFEEEVQRMGTFLSRVTKERELPLGFLTLMWESYDKILHDRHEDMSPEPACIHALHGIRQKVLLCLEKLS